MQQPADTNAEVFSQATRDVVQRYINSYGQGAFAANNMYHLAIPEALARAVEKAGTVDDTEKIAKAMRELEFDTITGKAHFVGSKTYGLANYMVTNVYMSKFEGGKFVTFDARSGDIP